jgi:hypothetical protein
MNVHASARGGGGAGVNTVSKDDSYDDKAKEASFLFRPDRERAHASAKGVRSAGVKAIDDNNSYYDNVASAGQLDNRGRKPEIAGRALSRRGEAERRHPSSASTA